MKKHLTLFKLATLPLTFWGGRANANIPIPERICSGKNDSAPVFLHRSADGLLQNFEVFVDGLGRYRGRYNALSPEAIIQICAKGIAFVVRGTPDVPVGNWALSFSAVSARTQP